MIKIITDSTFYIPKELCAANDIRVIPLVCRLGEEEYVEGFPGEYKEFFDKITVGKSFPKTACPSPDDYKKIFEEILAAGNEVLCLCLTSKISGSYQSACIAAKELGSDKITVIDSRTTIAGGRYVADRAVEAVAAGKTREEITAILSNLAECAYLACFPINLDYFIRGGRVKGFSAIIGKLARIKPIIVMENGQLVPEKKVFTLAAGEAHFLSKIEKEVKAGNVEKLYFGYTYNDKYMQAFKQKVFAHFPELEAISEDYEIGPVIGMHVGPYSYGPLMITKNPIR